LLKSNIPWNSELSYPQAIATLSDSHHFVCELKYLHQSWFVSNKYCSMYKKLLLIKHFHVKQHFKKNWYNKKESYHPLCMQTKHNGPAGVHGNGTVNLLILVLYIGLRPLYEMLGGHLLNIFYPYSFRDVQRFEISPYRHISPARKTSFFSIFFLLFFFCASYQKII